MLILTENLSSWFSGSGNVPLYSNGFYVAMTINGLGRLCTVPSAVTLASFIASRRALWVLGVALFISSASTILANTGPDLNLNSPVA